VLILPQQHVKPTVSSPHVPSQATAHRSQPTAVRVISNRSSPKTRK